MAASSRDPLDRATEAPVLRGMLTRFAEPADPDDVRWAESGVRFVVAPMAADEARAARFAWDTVASLSRPADGQPVSAIVRYQDEVAIAAVAAEFAKCSQEDLAGAVRALTGGTAWESGASGLLDSARRNAPDWGFADPSAPPGCGVVSYDLRGSSAHSIDLRSLVAAAALVLDRYQAGGAVGIAWRDLDGSGACGVVEGSVRVADGQTARELLAEFEPGRSSGQSDAVLEVACGRSAADRYSPPGRSLPPIVVSVETIPDGTATAVCWFDQRLVDPRIAESISSQLFDAAQLLANAAAAGQDIPLTVLDPLRAEQKSEVLRLGVTPRLTVSEFRRIDERFAAVARRNPEATAVRDAERRLTYRELDAEASKLAAGLRRRGVVPGQSVGVCLERSHRLVVTLLAVLKAGCTYVPMDPWYPDNRLRYQTADSAVAFVVTDRKPFPLIDADRAESFEKLSESGEAAPADSAEAGLDEAHAAAYVIYTSGSTGRPKGVVVRHSSVLALIDATEAEFGFGPRDVWTLFHSAAFDFSVWETWGCLLTGGTLVVVPHWATRDPRQLHALLVEHQVTVLNQTPSAFQQMDAQDRDTPSPLGLRLVVFGGEPLDAGMLGSWLTRHPHTQCRLVNMYGITETTVHVTAEDVTPETVRSNSGTVGRALPGWSISIRDQQGRVLPPGAIGEIYVGGEGVASHYLGKPGLTAERFPTDPDGGCGRVYRSGDRGRLRLDGRLDHLGRLDSQVKIRGHRIELEEVRRVLASAPSVAAAAVVPRGSGSLGHVVERIDGYVVLRSGGVVARVLEHARELLPDYMVPATLTALDALPLTTNGKVDVAGLPEPVPSPPAAAADAVLVLDGDQHGVERQILSLWSRHLGFQVDPEANFFESGGNSLMAGRLLAEVRRAGLPGISARDFYSCLSAREFAHLVAGRRKTIGPLTRGVEESA